MGQARGGSLLEMKVILVDCAVAGGRLRFGWVAPEGFELEAGAVDGIFGPDRHFGA